MAKRNLSPPAPPSHSEVIDLAAWLVESWASQGRIGFGDDKGIYEIETQIERCIPRQECDDLLKNDVFSLRQRLVSTIKSQVEADPQFLIAARLAIDRIQTWKHRPEPHLSNVPLSFVDTSQSAPTSGMGGLLAGDIPFGRPAFSISRLSNDRPSGPIGILLLGASPMGSADLYLREEARRIDEAIQSGLFRDWLKLHSNLAARVSDIQPQMARFRPGLLHFSCHGEYEELQLQDSLGSAASITNIGSLLRLFADKLRCVVLNSCFSRAQAEDISNHIPCVIGMFPWISDRAAILFSEGFYGGLANGFSVAASTELGRARIGLESPGETDRPILFSTLCNPKDIFLTPSGTRLGD
jgi:hypothetical protein